MAQTKGLEKSLFTVHLLPLNVRPFVRPPARPSDRPSGPSAHQSVGPSVRPPVRSSVRPPVRPSARPSVRQTKFISNLKKLMSSLNNVYIKFKQSSYHV